MFISCFLYFRVYNYNTRFDRQTRIKSFTLYYYYIIRTKQKMEVYLYNNTFAFIYRLKVIRVHTLLSYLAKNTDFQNDTLLLGENREKFVFVRFFLVFEKWHVLIFLYNVVYSLRMCCTPRGLSNYIGFNRFKNVHCYLYAPTV